MERTTYTVRYVPYEKTTLKERGKSQGTLYVGNMRYVLFSNSEGGENWDLEIILALRKRGFGQAKRNPGNTITLEATVEEVVSNTIKK